MATMGKAIELQDLRQPLKLSGDCFKANVDSVKDTTCPDSPDELMHREDDHINRPSVRGPYRPVRNGTIRGSVFAMLTSALGSGCLSLPYRAGRLGLVMFVVLTVACAALSYLGMYFMERIIVRYKVPSYSQMVRRAYGERITKLAEVVLITYPLAITVSVQVIFSKFITQLFADVLAFDLFENRDLEVYNSAGNVARVVVALAHVALNYKNFFLEDLRDMLHSLGKFSVTGVVFCMICILITALTGFTKTVGGEALEYKSILTMDSSKVEFLEPLSGMLLLQSLSGIFYTFLNPQFVFPLISHLKRPTRKRVDRIFLYSHYELLLIYLGIGILGYLLLSQHIDVVPIASLIVISIPTAPLLLGKLMLAIAMFFTFPLQVFTARELTYEAFDIERSPANMRWLNWAMVASTCLVGILFQQVTMYFGFIGGTMGVMMAVLIPALCMRKLVTCSTTDTALYCLALVMSAVLFVGAVESLSSA